MRTSLVARQVEPVRASFTRAAYTDDRLKRAVLNAANTGRLASGGTVGRVVVAPDPVRASRRAVRLRRQSLSIQISLRVARHRVAADWH
jgi:hypothetical protein